jgi:hypothetical protein
MFAMISSPKISAIGFAAIPSLSSLVKWLPLAAKTVAAPRNKTGLSVADIADVSARATARSGLKVQRKPKARLRTA